MWWMRWHSREDSIRIGPGRGTIRLRGYDYGRSGYYFLTIRAVDHLFGVVHNRTTTLNAYGRIVHKCWRAIPDHSSGVGIDSFIVMPDHIHGILFLDRQRPRAVGRIAPGCLGTIVRSFKSAATARINELRGTVSARVWQRNYYEHIVRSPEELDHIRHYIETNPDRWNGGDRQRRPKNR
jgi:REP-associated tyrosine transposase